MSYVIAAPEYVAAAATDLAGIGSAISDANTFAAVPTLGAVIPAGADAVSAEIAALFSAHAQAYQTISAQAAAFHDQFVQLMSFGGQQYALSEAANLASFQTGSVNMPQQTLAGHLTDQTGHVMPAAAVAQTVAITSAAAGPALAAAPTGSVGSVAGLGSVGGMGSAVAAGSVGSVSRQPLPSPQAASTAETTESLSRPAVSALPAPIAARAVPAAAAAPEPAAPRVVANEEVAY
jgi:hypothetical protein